MEPWEVDPEIESAINNDIDTPKILLRLRGIEKSEQGNKRALFLYADQILGLDLSRVPEKRELTEQQSQLLKEREIARATKDFAESDRLRRVLEESGLEIQDGPQGQSWS